jgi:hypothetical protein
MTSKLFIMVVIGMVILAPAAMHAAGQPALSRTQIKMFAPFHHGRIGIAVTAEAGGPCFARSGKWIAARQSGTYSRRTEKSVVLETVDIAVAWY